MTGWTAERLIQFERRVADAFLAKRIKAPVHLCSDGQAQPLIDIFRDVQPDDWVFSTWRSHFHCLLRGVPEDEVFDAILAGRSMYLQFPKYNVFSSAIVGGILPIALGVAHGIRRTTSAATVWAFVGDMAARTGLFHETKQYAIGNQLPLRFVIEANGLSTDTPTDIAWGRNKWEDDDDPYIRGYEYTRNYPHVGVGSHVTF